MLHSPFEANTCAPSVFVRNQLLEEPGEEGGGEGEGEVKQDIPMDTLEKNVNLFILDVSNSIRKRYLMSRLHGLLLVLSKGDCIGRCWLKIFI